MNPSHCIASGESTCARVDVWLVRTKSKEPSTGQLQLLDEAEHTRAGRFHFSRDRDHYVIAHAWLRTLLGQATGFAPERVEIEQASGKPRLRSRELFFNLSHTNGFVAIALSRGCELGVDVEGLRAWSSVSNFAGSVLHPRESASLAMLGADDRAARFFRTWCAKEAYTKATGLGLSQAFDGFDAELADDDQKWRLAVPGSARAWLRAGTVDGSHAFAAAALATKVDFSLQFVDA